MSGVRKLILNVSLKVENKVSDTSYGVLFYSCDLNY
jgi:hypothetical protein